MFKKNSITQGDSLELLKKIPDNSIDLVFADPPYNLQLRETLYRPDQTTVEAVTNDWDKFDTYQAYDEFCIVSVTDSGPGISEEDQKHIFDRFYRVDESRSRTSGGTGLGLAIVKSLIEAHNGKIYVKSTAGDGATFSFEIPMKS